MLNFFRKDKVVLALIVLCCIMINAVSFYGANFSPMLSDMVAASCSVKEIKDYGQIASNENIHSFSGPGYCWAKNTYPFIKVYLGQFSLFSSLRAENAVIFVYIFLTLFIPIVFYLIGRTIFADEKIALLSAFFGSFAPVLARIINLTAQNLFGILLILAFILFFAKYILVRKNIFLVLAILIFILLGLFHHLSFIVLFASLLMYFFVKGLKRPRYLLLFLVLLPFMLLILYLVGGLSIIGYVLINIIESGIFYKLGYIAPLWQFPSIIGYVLFCFSVLGLIIAVINWNRLEKQREIFIYLFCLAGFLMFFAQLYYLGIIFYNYRFIAFLFIPAVILGSLGFSWLLLILRKNFTKKFIAGFVILILSASFVHYFGYRQDEFMMRNQYVYTKEDFKAVIAWLRSHENNDNAILALLSYDHKEPTSLAYLTNYNLYFLDDFHLNNFKKSTEELDDENIKDIQSAETIFGRLFTRFDYFRNLRDKYLSDSLKASEDQNKLQNIFINPDSNSALKSFDDFKIDYILINSVMDADKKIRDSRNFARAYINNEWIIYKVKK